VHLYLVSVWKVTWILDVIWMSFVLSKHTIYSHMLLFIWLNWLSTREWTKVLNKEPKFNLVSNKNEKISRPRKDSLVENGLLVRPFSPSSTLNSRLNNFRQRGSKLLREPPPLVPVGNTNQGLKGDIKLLFYSNDWCKPLVPALKGDLSVSVGVSNLD
jgi:hypothetical protein